MQQDYDWLVESHRKQFESDLAAARTESELRGLRDKYLSRKHGLIPALLKTIAGAPAEKRPTLGRAANQLKQNLEATIEEKLGAVAAATRTRAPPRTGNCGRR